MCGAYALWNAIARDRYQLTYKQQMQAYIHYVRDVYRFIYDLSVRLDKINTVAGGKSHNERRAFAISSRKPLIKPTEISSSGQQNLSQPQHEDKTEDQRISEIYFKNHPAEE